MSSEINPLEEEKKVKGDALGWLFEMEVLNDPNTINALGLNIIKASKYIVDTQMVIDRDRRKMLVYLQLTRWGTWFSQQKVHDKVLSLLREVLPSFQFRVTFDPEILKKSVNVAKAI